MPWEALPNPMRRFIPNSGALLRWTSCRYLRISASKSALHGIPILGETCTQRVLQSIPRVSPDASGERPDSHVSYRSVNLNHKTGLRPRALDR